MFFWCYFKFCVMDTSPYLVHLFPTVFAGNHDDKMASAHKTSRKELAPMSLLGLKKKTLSGRDNAIVHFDKFLRESSGNDMRYDMK